MPDTNIVANNEITQNNKDVADDLIYFNMNVPGWFMNIGVEEKCNIIEGLADDLKKEKALSHEQMASEFLK